MDLYIDLIKSRLNTSRLVRKPVQVKGKNGKVFTRMMWTDPSQASTGHGVREIRSSQGLAHAIEEGIHNHPHYHEALEHQGVNLSTHESHHPPFHVPETKESVIAHHARLNRASKFFSNYEDVHARHLPHQVRPFTPPSSDSMPTKAGQPELKLKPTKRPEGAPSPINKEKPKVSTDDNLNDYLYSGNTNMSRMAESLVIIDDDANDEDSARMDYVESALYSVFGKATKEGMEKALSHPNGDYSVSLDLDVPLDSFYDDPKIEGRPVINMEMHDREGRKIGECDRYISRREDGGLDVHNSLLVVSPRVQGNGISTTMYSKMEKLWGHLAGEGKKVHLSVDANISVGVYAWAMKGFDFPNERGRQRALVQLQDFLGKNGISEKEVLKNSGIKSLEDLKSARDFATLDDGNDYDLSVSEGLKGHAHLGKAFMLLGKSSWTGVKVLNHEGKQVDNSPLEKSMNTSNRPIKSLSWSLPKEKVSKEGLTMGEDGKTHYHDDHWLHPEIGDHKVKKSIGLYIDLVKGVLNTGKLVKKMVYVRGKNGKVFPRMQWVNPQDASTGHGVRQIKSHEGLEQAHRDGISEHPEYHKALKEQGVDLLNHKHDHPHFFLPETYDSAANAEHRENNMEDLHDIVKEHEHHVHFPHGEKPSEMQHKIHEENSKEDFDEDKFSKDYGIHPEIHDIMKAIDKHLESVHDPDQSIFFTIKRLGDDIAFDHKHTIKNHISAKIDAEADDKFVRNVQNGALVEGNVNNHLSILGAHPQIARYAINKIIGENLANTLREDLKDCNLSVNFPESAEKSITQNGYTASTMMSYIKEHMGDEAVSIMEEHMSKEFSSERERIEAISDLDEGEDGDYDWWTVQERAEAEYNAIGLGLEDRKPTYIAFNHIGDITGAARDYGNGWFKIKDEKSVLNHCTATFDDSFANTKAIAKIFDMEHLKDLFILKAIDEQKSLDEMVRGEEPSRPWYTEWGIPIELQYHQPHLSPDQFEIQDPIALSQAMENQEKESPKSALTEEHLSELKKKIDALGDISIPLDDDDDDDYDLIDINDPDDDIDFDDFDDLEDFEIEDDEPDSTNNK